MAEVEVAGRVRRDYVWRVPERETTIQAAIRLALGKEPDLTLWRNNTGRAQYEAEDGPRRVRYGLVKGSSDLVGILGPAGRFVALEVKRPRKKPTEEQRMFLDLVRSRGGFAAVVDSVASALAAIERARRGEHQ